MPKIIKKRSEKSGLAPGSLVHIGEKKSKEMKITLLEYDELHFQETQVETAEECLSNKDNLTITWINMDGIHEVEVLEKLGDYFGLHTLVLEDILNTDHRPKMEEFGDHIYIILKILDFNDKSSRVVTEQVSLILGLFELCPFFSGERRRYFCSNQRANKEWEGPHKKNEGRLSLLCFIRLYSR